MEDEKITEQEIRALVQRFAERITEYVLLDVPRDRLVAFIKRQKSFWESIERGEQGPPPDQDPDMIRNTVENLLDDGLVQAVRLEIMRSHGRDLSRVQN